MSKHEKVKQECIKSILHLIPDYVDDIVNAVKEDQKHGLNTQKKLMKCLIIVTGGGTMVPQVYLDLFKQKIGQSNYYTKFTMMKVPWFGIASRNVDK